MNVLDSNTPEAALLTAYREYDPRYEDTSDEAAWCYVRSALLHMMDPRNDQKATVELFATTWHGSATDRCAQSSENSSASLSTP